MIKAVFFDFDGTLADTLPLCVAAFKKAMEPLAGREISDEEILATFGPSEEATISVFIPEHFDEGLAQYHKYYELLHDDYAAKPFDGVFDILSYLKSKGIILALITGKGRKSADISLPRLGLDKYFDAIETGTPTGLKKVEDIKMLLDRFGLKKDEVFYVGDTITDITAAREAGIGIVSVAWASTAEYEALARLRPDQVFDVIEQFETYIKTLV